MYNIKDVFLFDRIPEPLREQAVQKMEPPTTFRKGQVILSNNNYKKVLGIVLSGRAVAIDGRITKRAFLAGDIFGAASMFVAAEEYSGTIIAKTDIVIQFISQQKLTQMFEQDIRIAENYITFLSGKVRYLNKKLNQMAAGSTKDRLYRYIVGTASGSTLEIKDMTLLASLTGIGRTSLYRDLAELEKSGLIKKEKNIIRVEKL